VVVGVVVAVAVTLVSTGYEKSVGLATGVRIGIQREKNAKESYRFSGPSLAKKGLSVLVQIASTSILTTTRGGDLMYRGRGPARVHQFGWL